MKEEKILFEFFIILLLSSSVNSKDFLDDVVSFFLQKQQKILKVNNVKRKDNIKRKIITILFKQTSFHYCNISYYNIYIMYYYCYNDCKDEFIKFYLK